MGAYEKMAYWGSTRRRASSVAEREWATIQLCTLPASCLQAVRARLDVELADYARHHDALLREELECVIFALGFIVTEPGEGDVKEQAFALECWLEEQLEGLDAME
jgi:hypothetical protein